MWILALVLGVGCATSFVVAMLTTPEHSSNTAPIREPGSNRGFGVGLVLGLGAGIAIGFAVRGRQVEAAHSSRNKP